MMSCELLATHGPVYPGPKIVYHNAQWTSHPEHQNTQWSAQNQSAQWTAQNQSFHSYYSRGTSYTTRDITRDTNFIADVSLTSSTTDITSSNHRESGYSTRDSGYATTYSRDSAYSREFPLNDHNFSSDQGFEEFSSDNSWANNTYPGPNTWARRHTLNHINTSNVSMETSSVNVETSRKRQKVSRPSNSFRRKSLLFFKMLGSGEWRDRSEKYEVRKCAREEDSAGSTETLRKEEDVVRKTREAEEEIHRTVSHTTDHVVLRRASRSTTRRPHPDATPQITDERPPRPPKPPRPASCYFNVRTNQPDPAAPSGFQRKLRRLSASVKNFSLERMLYHRKHSGPLKEEELQTDSKPGYVEPRRLSDPAISNRKSLPADFRYENVTSYFDQQARSLHDDSTDTADRLDRSNSLEFDEHLSSIRRTHSEKEKHETESSEYPGISSKAKSITEQLERIRSNLNKSAGIPPLEFTDWKDFVPPSVVEGLGKKDMDQQHHIWELVTTEHNHITIISTVINSLLTCLRELHNENFLTKIREHDVFLNIERIREVHLAFWNECIVPLINTAKETGEPLNPDILTGSSTLFEEELNPLFEYCIKYIESKQYIKAQQSKNNDFKEYINWCSNEIRNQHNKLGVDDMLIKPIQRIQKYPILIKDILRKTTDDDSRSALSSFLEKVKVFVESLNRRKEEREEQQKIEQIKERIESYNVLPSVNNNTNEQISHILTKFNKFDLADKVPLLNSQRKFLHETSCKMDTKLESKSTQDVTVFLFSDHILITRPSKGSKKKNRIIKQAMTLDRVEIEELTCASHTNVIVYLNEYGSLVDMFLLQSPNQESHQTLLNTVIQAKDNHKREKNKLYTDMDASKSVSTCSVNSAGNQQDSPAVARHAAASVTRSLSELGPARRNLVDPASSVSRAQSMPASNDKRNHLPQTQAMSSASSSSSSSSSVSEGGGSEGSSKIVPLSHIKESDKSGDSGEELTVIPSTETDTLKNCRADNFITDNMNLSSEFKGKLDLNKNIHDSVNLQAADDKILFTKSDAIFIDKTNAQSES